MANHGAEETDEDRYIEHTDSSVLKQLADGTRVLSNYVEPGEAIVVSDRSAPGGDETGNEPEANAAASSVVDQGSFDSDNPNTVDPATQSDDAQVQQDGQHEQDSGNANRTTAGSGPSLSS